jgi:hypothetical protein
MTMRLRRGRAISWRRSTHPPLLFETLRERVPLSCRFFILGFPQNKNAAPLAEPFRRKRRGFITRFGLVGLDWREYVVSDKGLCRPTDLAVSRGNPSKARERLGWVTKHQIADIVSLMVILASSKYMKIFSLK